jgi:hypothetical protein
MERRLAAGGPQYEICSKVCGLAVVHTSMSGAATI